MTEPSTRFRVLIVAKSPVAGLAKTRLCPPMTPEQAADIAAASLLDTLTAVYETPGAAPVLALAGDLGSARRHAELTALLANTDVIGQRSGDLAARIVRAMADTSHPRPRKPTVLIGMDTPQVTPELLTRCADPIVSGRHEAALGPATDGGWWLLGLADPTRSTVLDRIGEVVMSVRDTGARTLRALHAAGLSVATAPHLSDVDTMEDARAVASGVPGSRFAHAVENAVAGVRAA